MRHPDTQHLLSSADVGSMNRARVMRFLYVNGPLTRADLASRLKVSRATIGTVVQPLLDSGVLVEQAALASGGAGGKPARPLWFGTGRALGAIYVSSEEWIVAALGMNGEIIDREHGLVADDDTALIMTQLLNACRQVLPHRELAGVGVAFAGMVDTVDGVLLHNYRRPAIGQLPIGGQLRDVLQVPVFVDHHPRVQAFGDAWFGLGRELDSFASVITGEVLGVGMFHDGQVSRGVRGAGGEVGHTVVDLEGGQCLCGRRGCWETVATLGWLRGAAQALGLPDAPSVTTEALARLADEGQTQAIRLLDDYVVRISVGLANIEQMLGLGTYILHGDVVGGGEAARQRLQELLVLNSPQRTPEPQVLFATEPHESTLRGAAGLVLSGLYRSKI